MAAWLRRLAVRLFIAQALVMFGALQLLAAPVDDALASYLGRNGLYFPGQRAPACGTEYLVTLLSRWQRCLLSLSDTHDFADLIVRETRGRITHVTAVPRHVALGDLLALYGDPVSVDQSGQMVCWEGGIQALTRAGGRRAHWSAVVLILMDSVPCDRGESA